MVLVTCSVGRRERPSRGWSMLQKPTFSCAKAPRVAASFQLEWRDFDYARILDELAQQALEVFAVERSVFEGHGELDQQGAEQSSVAMASRPSRVGRSSSSVGRMVAAEVGSMTAIGEWVKAR